MDSPQVVRGIRSLASPGDYPRWSDLCFLDARWILRWFVVSRIGRSRLHVEGTGRTPVSDNGVGFWRGAVDFVYGSALGQSGASVDCVHPLGEQHRSSRWNGWNHISVFSSGDLSHREYRGGSCAGRSTLHLVEPRCTDHGAPRSDRGREFRPRALYRGSAGRSVSRSTGVAGCCGIQTEKDSCWENTFRTRGLTRWACPSEIPEGVFVLSSFVLEAHNKRRCCHTAVRQIGLVESPRTPAFNDYSCGCSLVSAGAAPL